LKHKGIIEESKKYRIRKSKFRSGFLVFYCLLLTACCLLTSCGKKGDPTLKSYEKPDPPSVLRAIHRESEIILLWEFPKDKEPAIKGFYLMKSTGGDFEKIATLENNKRSYIDNDFKTGSTYKYKIVSQNLKGIISNDSNIIQIVPEISPPPGNILFKIEHDSLILNWESAGDRIMYNIYKSNEKGTYQLMPVNKEPVKETSFRDNFDIKGPVYYTIRSLVGSDIRDEGAASEEIEINPFEFIPSSPSGLQAVVKKENVYLIWKEAPETWVAGYKVYREINKKEGFIFIGETQTPAFLDKDKPSTKRNYRVTALGPSKEGPPAEIRDIVFIPYR
jgi:fibronectin type 3 domain-containing protein